MGTPEFALPTLARLASAYHIGGVVTQPDRPAGRGQRLLASPVKELALAEGLPIYQPARLRDPEAVACVRAWEPDLIIVAAFGQILSAEVLAIPRRGCLNVHASLLPRWRGAAPIQAALLAGDAVTGVTIMQMDAGLDTGPILAARATHIGDAENAGELESRLAELGAALLLDVLPDYLAGRLEPRPQPTEGVTLARSFRKQAPEIDWTQPASQLHNHVRAFAPTPGAYTTWEGQRVKVLAAEPVAVSPSEPAISGQVSLYDNFPSVVTGAGQLVLKQVQMAGKRPLNGDVFVQGQRKFVGARLGSQTPGE